MKKLLAIALSAVLLMGLTACSSSEEASETTGTETTTTEPANKLEEVLASGELVVAMSPDFAPYEFINLETGEVVGAEVSLAQYIADEMGLELVIEQMNFDACLAAVPQGSVDISISGFAQTPERAENLEFSVGYKWEPETGDSGQTFIVLEENKDIYTTPEDLSGKTVGAQAASLQAEFVAEQMPEDVVYEPVTSTSDGVIQLINGKIDALVLTTDNAEQFKANYPELHISDFRFEYVSPGTVAIGKKGETELMEAVSAAITKAESEGLFQVWLAEANELAESLNTPEE